MNFLFLLQIVLNIILLFGIVYCLNLLKKERLDARQNQKYLNDLKQLKETLDQSVQEALNVSNKLNREIGQKLAEIKEMGLLYEREREQLKKLLSQSGTLDKPEPNDVSQSPAELQDKYSDVLKLAAQGLSPREIAMKTNLPLGEVELALSLRKR